MMTTLKLDDWISLKVLGVNRQTFALWKPGVLGNELRPYTLLAVLVAGGCEDYACYCGIAPCEDADSPEIIQWVAHYGDKLSFAAACGHFPGGELDEAKYRL